MCLENQLLSLVGKALPCNWWDSWYSLTDIPNVVLVPEPGTKEMINGNTPIVPHNLTEVPVSPAFVSYLQDRLHVGADEPGGIGDQVPQHAGTLFFNSSNATVLQLCQNL